jgi:hypothetical protein
MANLSESLDVLDERWSGDLVSESPLQPLFERIELLDQLVDGVGHRLLCAPFAIESLLDARLQQDGYAGLARHSLGLPSEKFRCALDHFACRMAKQIDRVLDATCAFERTRVHRKSQVLGQLSPVEGLGLPRQLRRSLQQPAIHVGPNQPLSELLQSSLRVRRLLLAKAIQHHLPPEVPPPSSRRLLRLRPADTPAAVWPWRVMPAVSAPCQHRSRGTSTPALPGSPRRRARGDGRGGTRTACGFFPAVAAGAPPAS